MPEITAPPTQRRPQLHRVRDAVAVFRAQPGWSKATMLGALATAALLIAVVAVTAVQAAEYATASRGEVDRLSAAIVARDADVSDLEGRLAAANRLVDGVDERESGLDTRESGLDTRSAELDGRSAGLDAREAAVGTAETAKKANSFGTGTFTVGTDIQPGTYQTAGTDGCYYERLRGTGGQLGDIIANDNPRGQVIVTIDAGDAAFSSQDCGTWTKTG